MACVRGEREIRTGNDYSELSHLTTGLDYRAEKWLVDVETDIPPVGVVRA